MLRPGTESRPSDERRRARLLQRYAGTRSPRDLEALVLSYRPLAAALARRYAVAAAAPEDLEQVACEGLIKAIQRFEPGRGTAFTSFAVPTILGELRRFVRDTAWPAHVPRTLQERVRTARAAADTHTAEHGRAPTAATLAATLGWDEADVVEAFGVSAALNTVPLDAPVRDDAGTLPATEVIGGDDPGYDRVECLDAIAASLPVLEHGERRMLRLYFGEELTQREIARRIGVSRSEVGRHLGSAVERLRSAVAA